MLSDVASYPDERIADGLARCRRTIKPIKGYVTFNVAILMENMGVMAEPSPADARKAEAAAAWEQIRQGFYSCGDCDFQHIEDKVLHGLSPQAAATFRMIGGKDRIIRTMIQDIHFVQKAFMDAYETHENVTALGLGAAPEVRDLAGMIGREWPGLTAVRATERRL
jgi:hypothetical protein